MAMEGDFPWGGGHTVEETDQVSQKSILQTCIIVLTTCHLNRLNLKINKINVKTRWKMYTRAKKTARSFPQEASIASGALKGGIFPR